jgi:hypothetical protein
MVYGTYHYTNLYFATLQQAPFSGGINVRLLPMSRYICNTRVGTALDKAPCVHVLAGLSVKTKALGFNQLQIIAHMR